jgi:two-component system sensor kinase FixL
VEQPGAPHVLVVEDDVQVRNLIVRALGNEYEIATASNGLDGLAAAQAIRPSLVITDLLMPQLTGDELVRRIREHHDLDATSILVLTAHGDDERRVALLSQGAQDYLTKPFAIGELRARARNLVAAQRARALILDRGAARESAIFEVALDAIISMDHRGLVTEFNAAAERIFGHSREEAVGRSLADLIIPPSLRQAHERGLQHYLAAHEGPVVGKRIELTGMRKDGTEFPIEVSICRIPGSDPPAFTGFLRDLTSAKQSAEALRAAEMRAAAVELKWKAEQRFRKLLDSAPDAMVIVDARGVIVDVNSTVTSLFGFPRGELLGQDVDVLVPARLREEHRRERQAYLGNGTSRPMASNLELRGLHKDGREIPIDINLSPIEMDDGLVVVAAIRDISARKRAEKVERELIQEQAARAAAEEAVRIRDDFVAIAGHELKTPLTAMMLQVQMLQRTVRQERPGDLEARIDKIVRSGARLERLIEQLLDVSRIAAGHLCLERTACDLCELARDVVDRFVDASTQANCPITVHATGSVQGVWDRARLEAVLGNLLSNAIKFGRGGPIDVVVTTADGSALVKVTDHGIGIPPEDRAKLFRRFERAIAARQFGGFGLGLWICRNIVEASGGTIDVESERGRGSTFTVHLPLA